MYYFSQLIGRLLLTHARVKKLLDFREITKYSGCSHVEVTSVNGDRVSIHIERRTYRLKYALGWDKYLTSYRVHSIPTGVPHHCVAVECAKVLTIPQPLHRFASDKTQLEMVIQLYITHLLRAVSDSIKAESRVK